MKIHDQTLLLTSSPIFWCNVVQNAKVLINLSLWKFSKIPKIFPGLLLQMYYFIHDKKDYVKIDYVNLNYCKLFIKNDTKFLKNLTIVSFIYYKSLIIKEFGVIFCSSSLFTCIFILKIKNQQIHMRRIIILGNTDFAT